MRKIMFFDVDGTISMPITGKIPESAIRAIRKARENGNLAFINTGRTFMSVEEKYRNIGFDGYVCGCGTAIFAEDRCIYQSTLSEEHARRIAERVREYGLAAIYEASENVFFDPMLPAHSIVERIGRHFASVKTLLPENLEDAKISFDKFCVWETPGSDFAGFYEGISEEFWYADHGHQMHELVPTGHTKATGIQFLMDYYDIPLENCYAIGDGCNDLSMLQFVPNSIAMGNGRKEIFPHCSYVTDPIDEDGLEKALIHYGFL